MKRFERLYEPIWIGKTQIKNRIVMAPMGIEYMVDQDGSLNRRVVDYYLERVRNDVGMIVSGNIKVENEIEQLEECTPRITEIGLGYLGELCEVAHSFDVRVFLQLTAGFGRVTVPSTLRDQPVSASAFANFWDPNLLCRALSRAEIRKIVSAIGSTAEKLIVAGVDGVELHGHEGYLFDQFTTSIWNNRTDEYGGPLENRLRFPIECLQEIRKRVGKDFPVQYRFGLKHYMKDINRGALPNEIFDEVGRDVEEGLQMALMLEAAGFDALHVDAGCYESWYWPHPPSYQDYGCMINMSARVKKVVKIPVIGVGRLDDPELAARAIADGKADMIAIGRGLLADPLWASKVRTGSVGDIRPCIACYDACVGNYSRLRPISCAVNPSCGRESSHRLVPTQALKNIAVVGGGIAGMEAARVAARRGHKVTLYEKDSVLGGMVNKVSVPRFKISLKRLLVWYQRQLEKVGVEIVLGTQITPDFLEKQNPNVVLVATGARPIIPNLPGIDREKVISSVDLLLGKKQAGMHTVIIGGGLAGCEIAIWLAENGKKATIVEMLPQLMTGGVMVPHQVKQMVVDLLDVNKIEVIKNAQVTEITQEGVLLSQSNSRVRELQADTVVLSIGFQANSDLYELLAKRFDCIYALGDCRQPKNIMQAVWDAYEVSRSI
jgi:2-enoate reductase